MSESQTKKLKSMAKLFYLSQPTNMPNKKTYPTIFKELKQIHKKKSK